MELTLTHEEYMRLHRLLSVPSSWPSRDFLPLERRVSGGKQIGFLANLEGHRHQVFLSNPPHNYTEPLTYNAVKRYLDIPYDSINGIIGDGWRVR